MLSDKLRDGANSKGFKTILALIIVSFVLTGVGGYLIPRLDTDPVKIGPYKVTSSEWNEQYNRRAQAIHQMGGSSMLENPQYVVDLKKRVLEEIVNNVAFNSSVWDMNIRIGDEQVREVIRNNPAFHKNGKFDNDLYLATIRNYGYNPEYFGEQLRVSIMADSVSRPVLAVSSIAMPYEISNFEKLLSQVRNVDLYTVDTSEIAANTKVSDEEAKSYYDEHNDAFMEAATVRFNYLLLSVEDLKKQVEVNDSKLEEFFNLNQDDFALDETRDIAHILIRKGSENEKERVEKVSKALADGKDFASLAKEYSDDGSTKNNGGQMGAFARGQLSSSLDAAVFALKAGEVSPVIEDEYGYHFVKLLKIIAPHTPTLAQVKSDVTEAYIKAQARDLYNQKVTTMSDISFENPDSLDATAEALGLTIIDSGVVSQGDKTATWPLNTDEVQKLAFNEEVYSAGVNSQVINVDDETAIVINVVDHHDAALKPFDEVKDKALTLVKDEKVARSAKAALENLGNNLKQKGDVTLPANISVSKNVEISPDSSSVSASFINAVFAIASDSERSFTIEDNNGKMTLAVLNSISENQERINQFKQIIPYQFSQYQNINAQSALFRQARDLSDIEYNQEAIDLVTNTSEQDI